MAYYPPVGSASRQGSWATEGCIRGASLGPVVVPGAPSAFKPVPRTGRPTNPSLVRRRASFHRFRRGREAVPHPDDEHEPEPEPEPETALMPFMLYVDWFLRFLLFVFFARGVDMWVHIHVPPWFLCFLTIASKTNLFHDIWNCIPWMREWEKRLRDPDYDY